MSAAELRRRSVLAAQRPLQEEPVTEAVDTDAEKKGEAEEVVATDEEPHESVAEPPKDDSEDVPTATTASDRQASAPGINMAEVS